MTDAARRYWVQYRVRLDGPAPAYQGFTLAVVAYTAEDAAFQARTLRGSKENEFVVT